MKKSKSFSHAPNGGKVMTAYREARDALLRGGLPARVLPAFGEDPRSWTPGEVRSALLLSAHLWGTLSLDLEDEVDLRIHLRLLDLQEETGLGPWVRHLPRALEGVVPGRNPLPPEEAARRIAQGERVPGSLEDSYLEAVARALQKEERLARARVRVEALLTRKEGARVTPRDTKVILGRIRAGKPVWVQATEEEFAQLLESVARTLAREQEGFLPAGWGWTRAQDRPHPRVQEAIRRLWDLVKGEAQARNEGTLEEADDREGPHKVFLREEEVALLQGLGFEVDPMSRASSLEALERALNLDLGREVELLLTEEELRHLDLDPVMGYKAVRARLLGARRRLEGRRTAPQAWYKALADYLARVRPMSQEQARKAFARAKEGDERAKRALAVEAALGAMEVLVRYPALREEAVALAWELGLEAVEAQRSPHAHPGAYAYRQALYRAPYWVEARRQAVAVDERTAAALHRLRKAFGRHPGASLEELARAARVPLEWAEAAMPLVDPAWGLEEPIPGTEGLTLADTLAGGEDPADQAEEAVLREAVRRAVAELPQWLRAPLELVALEGLPLEDAASALAIPLEEVEARLALAQNALGAREDLRALAEAL